MRNGSGLSILGSFIGSVTMTWGWDDVGFYMRSFARRGGKVGRSESPSSSRSVLTLTPLGEPS